MVKPLKKGGKKIKKIMVSNSPKKPIRILDNFSSVSSITILSPNTLAKKKLKLNVELLPCSINVQGKKSLSLSPKTMTVE